MSVGYVNIPRICSRRPRKSADMLLVLEVFLEVGKEQRSAMRVAGEV
jgi:hypothetical protein